MAGELGALCAAALSTKAILHKKSINYDWRSVVGAGQGGKAEVIGKLEDAKNWESGKGVEAKRNG